MTSPGKKEGIEVVAPPTPPRPPSPPHHSMMTPPSGDRRNIYMSSAFENSPRTRIAISESMEQVELITPPRPVYKRTTSAPAAAAAASGGRAAANNNNQHRHQRQDSSVSKNSSDSQNKNSAITTSSTSTKPSKSGKKPKSKLTYVQMAKMGYQELVHAIIRPPRSKYPLEALGAEKFRFCGKQFERKDFGVVNDRGLLIECSMWQRVQEGGEADRDLEDEADIERQESELTDATPARGKIQFIPQPKSSSLNDSVGSIEKGQLLYVTMPDSNETEDTAFSSTPSKPQSDVDNQSPGPHRSSIFSPEAKSRPSSEQFVQSSVLTSPRSRTLERRPVLIYLHGNSSSRTEVIPQLGHLLALGLAVVAFDFSGSGRSEGDFVSLGYYEREDLQTVINYLRASGTVSSIALWGRSMGAATALMYGSRDNTISCMILDSPFIDLATLAQELVERGKQHGVHVPQIVVSMVMRMLKSSVKQEARFNIKHISPVSHAPKCFIPAMIVAGEHDDFIKKRHAEVIHRQYAGDKNLVIVDGDHNSPRPRYMVQGAMLFLQSCMNVSASLELIVPPDTSLLAPPWLSPENLRRLSSSLTLRKGTGGGRLWLPAQNPTHSSKERKKKQHQQRLTAPPSLNDEDRFCFSRSSTDVSRKNSQENIVAPYDVTGATLPDMSKRQQEIQKSLFKMLGEDEVPMK
eukprot:scaffold11797_cov144-Skeletonema_menzelii.AAC.4